MKTCEDGLSCPAAILSHDGLVPFHHTAGYGWTAIGHPVPDPAGL